MARSKRPWLRILSATFVVGAALASIGAKPASKITILDRVRVGGYAEDLAFVPSGPFANHIVFVEGYEVWGVAGQAAGNQKARKLFELNGFDTVPRATGIAYVESRRLFVVNDSGPSNFYFVDHGGRLQGQASMTFPLPDGFTPSYVEGIAYIPPTAGRYPDHLVMAAQSDDGSGSLLIVDLDGNVVRHFDVDCVDLSGNPITGVGSVEYLPGDRLVITDFNSQCIYIVDFDGVAAEPAIILDTAGIGEGVTRLPDGRIVVAEWPQNLLFFDSDLNRLPADDGQYVVGLGLTNARALAWDSDTGRHLLSYVEPLSSYPSAIAEATPHGAAPEKTIDLTDWEGYTPTLFLNTRHLTYLENEGLVAVADQGRSRPAPPSGVTLPYFRGLLTWDTGTGQLVDQIDLCVPSATYWPCTCTKDYGSLQPTNLLGRAVGVAYIPGATPAGGKFAVRFSVGVSAGDPGSEDSWMVYLFDRAGTPAGSIDFHDKAGMSSVGALEYFDPGDGSGGRFLVLGSVPESSDPQLLITDLEGNRLAILNVRTELGLQSPGEVSVITTGPQKGAFAVIDVTAQTLLVFRWK